MYQKILVTPPQLLNLMKIHLAVTHVQMDEQTNRHHEANAHICNF